MTVTTPMIAILVLAVIMIAMLFNMRRNGRVKTNGELARAALVIVAAAAALIYFEAREERHARALLASMFDIGPDEAALAFKRGQYKGRRFQEIEAVYRLDGAGLPDVSLAGAKFRFWKTNKVSDFRAWMIDDFKISPGALAWQNLPRARDEQRLFPERGHLSRAMTPSEADISGAWLCAFVAVDDASAIKGAPQNVLPCHAVTVPAPSGITILALANRTDSTLHVLID